ncbi:hypothetical protein FVEG_08472 [Fusarium verticillioides 7600]|uniref:Zn(2)-C6 fungal-type domain-containing protein n=1 Tax=Gibberella moniliformis (strain M3125 / FGSC 7600) TaxID=334819 RepID=W7MM14_GIBM7|nr:hypothetical protein FVEG_08472 [Fusarium verticillioides 7600]EWG48809.1 hypothetical protein FVEG_08472 [Fusarium verticillioides 7600]RBR19388.1 hypothetical protein FVER53590_08472 [Fusarium verticillioides]
MDKSIRAQRVRAFSRKTRTGCLTCKKRHKKCDEEKPTCRRCRDGGYVCDGYTPQSKAVTTKTQTRTLPILAAKATPTLPLLPGDALESNYYVYFFSDIISQLEITPYLNREFWNRNILVPSQSSECVRHAVLALGATHWQYSARNELSAAPLDRFVLKHYNEAISKLTSNQESPPDMSTVLTCCILFVILESLRGDFGEAIRHLESGTRILTNHVPKTYLPNRDFQELAAIFHAIASQVAIFSPERVFPDVTHLLMPAAKKQKRIEGEFRNLDEAEDVMNKFDDMVNHISWDLDQEWENEESECNTQWSILRENVQTWQCQFEVLVNKLSAGKEPIDSEKVLNLRIQHKLWELLIEEQSSVDEDVEAHLDPAECNILLDQLEKLWCNPSRPRFGLKIDLTAALFQLYVYCTDENVRHRIIFMLRAQSRREIIWDSGQLADFLENDMVLRAVGLQTDRWPEIGPSASDGALLVFRPKSSRESSES